MSEVKPDRWFFLHLYRTTHFEGKRPDVAIRSGEERETSRISLVWKSNSSSVELDERDSFLRLDIGDERALHSDGEGDQLHLQLHLVFVRWISRNRSAMSPFSASLGERTASVRPPTSTFTASPLFHSTTLLSTRDVRSDCRSVNVGAWEPDLSRSEGESVPSFGNEGRGKRVNELNLFSDVL